MEELGPPGQHRGRPRREVWTTTTLVTLILVVCSFWIPKSNAATLPSRVLAPRDQIAEGVELRVLPIGDSITWGAQSSDENGYRSHLFNSLTSRGNEVDFVGAMTSGTMSDNQHEGYRGATIDQIEDLSSLGVYAAPNIVLLHAGTNNMKRDEDADNAPADLRSLIDFVFRHSEDAVVFVCQIIPSTTSDIQRRVNAYNDVLPGLVQDYVDNGKKVVLVPMNDALTTSDLADNLHPNDGGYEKMAAAYYKAIQAADADGLISKPGKWQDPPDSTSPDRCRSTPSWYRVGFIADGAKVATSDGDFKPAWVKRGIIAQGACPRAQLHFMDLNGDGLKDYACVDPETGATNVHLRRRDSDGGLSDNWEKLGEVATGAKGRDGTGVMFADLNGDGRDDYIYIDPSTGVVSAWINRLQNDDGVWQWQPLGRIAGGVGATNDTLQMVDIDGDGRADFCLINRSTGEVTGWLNTGADVIPDYYKLGIIASGASAPKGDTVVLGDFTGEGRADYMFVGDGGKVDGLVNRLNGSSLAPRWLSVFTLAEGPTGAEQDAVRLVDMTGDGKVDYLLVDKKTGEVTLWENIGTGGKYQPGEGVILCDLDGDGTSDYFWLDHTGKGWGYLNIGKGKNLWYDLGLIAKGDHKRENVRMAVLTTSKRADYVVLDEDTGRAVWYENLGPDGGWDWKYRGEIAAGPKHTIETKFGWNFTSKNVRFADLDGDGLDDYLYVNDQGATVMWRLKSTDPPEYGPATLVADGVGVLAQQVQFADTNGDGRLDYVVLGSTTGRARSWHHLGFREDGSIRWNTPLDFADGVGAPGRSIRITEMTGDKRADYLTVNPNNGRLRLWQNRCWPLDGDGSDGGDDGGDDDDDGGDDSEIVYVDDDVYKTPEMSCHAPCTIVLPPSALSKTTTITIKPYTTTLAVEGMGTTTITVTPAPLTVGTMSFYNIPIPSMGDSTTVVQPYPSLTVDPIKIPYTYVQDGKTKTTSRSLILPPWPKITQGPPEDWDSETSLPTGGSAIIPISFPPVTFPPPPDRGPRPTLTGSELPRPTDWDDIPIIIKPTDRKPETPEPTEPDDDDQGTIIPCDIWFLEFCNDDLGVKGWNIIVPPGVLPPGPPPPGAIQPPPGWRIKDPGPPPWPRITIGGDGSMSDVPDKPEPCETESASLCSSSTSYGVDGRGSTTTTKTVETCHTIYGCHVSDWDESTTTTGPSCEATAAARRAIPVADAIPTAVPSESGSRKRADDDDDVQMTSWQDPEEAWAGDEHIINSECDGKNYIVYCADPEDCDRLARRLERIQSFQYSFTTVKKIGSQRMEFTAFFWVEYLPIPLKNLIQQMSECALIYNPIAHQDSIGISGNGGNVIQDSQPAQRISNAWANSRVSIPPGVGEWWKNPDFSEDERNADDPTKSWIYDYYDDAELSSSDDAPIVYLVENCVDFSDAEVAGIRRLTHLASTEAYGPEVSTDCKHGTRMAATIAGRTLGLAPRTILIPVHTGAENWPSVLERYLHALVRILDDVLEHPDRADRAVINMSFRIQMAWVPEGPYGQIMGKLLKLLQKQGVISTAAIGNDGDDFRPANWDYPARFGIDQDDGIRNGLIIVGAINRVGEEADFSMSFTPWDAGNEDMVYAPGTGIAFPGGNNAQGTSYSTAIVSALISYIRSLPLTREWRDYLNKSPANMKKLIWELQRSLGPSKNQPLRSVWSGQVKEKNCLVDGFGITYQSSTTAEFYPCEDLAVWLLLQTCLVDLDNRPDLDPRSRAKRADDACPLPNAGSPLGDLPPPITWGEGDPSPTCTSNCGKLCEGYYCLPLPIGDPPTFTDPTDDPDSPTGPNLPPGTKFDPAEDCISVSIILEHDDGVFYQNRTLDVNNERYCNADTDQLTNPDYSVGCQDGFELGFTYAPGSTDQRTTLYTSMSVPGWEGEFVLTPYTTVHLPCDEDSEVCYDDNFYCFKSTACDFDVHCQNEDSDDGDDPAEPEEPEEPCVGSVKVVITELGSSVAQGASSMTVDGKEVCKNDESHISWSSGEEDTWEFDCNDGYSLRFETKEDGSDGLDVYFTLSGDDDEQHKELPQTKDENVECVGRFGEGLCPQRTYLSESDC